MPIFYPNSTPIVRPQCQQAVVEVEKTLFRGHPDVVDADLADYFEASRTPN